MMSRTPRVGAGILLAVLLFAGSASLSRQDDEGTCELQRAALKEDIRAQRDDGPETRQRLIDRIDALASRYGPSAPDCVGQLQEHRAFLYVMDERYPELVDWVGAYLAGAGRRTTARSRMLLHSQRGYALRQLGLASAGAQEAFLAASLADEVPATDGSKALTRAGYVARDLGEERSAIAYFESALRLIADSLDTNPDLLDPLGSTLTSLSLLIDDQVQRASSDAERDSLIDVLDRRTQEALAVLSTDGQPAGHRAHVANLSALVAAWRGDIPLARRRMQMSRTLSRRAGILMPMALWNTFMTEGRVAEVANEFGEARAAYERARAEAIARSEPGNEADALERLGRLDERERRWDDAAMRYAAAIERREGFRDRLGLEDWSASAFASMQAPYRGLVRVKLSQGDVAGAFSTLDQTRARYLRDLRRHHAVRAALRPDTRRAVDSVSEHLSEARRAAFLAETAPEQAALRQKISALQREIARLSPAPTDTTDLGLNLDTLRHTLHAQRRTLIAYMIDEEDALAFVVTPDTLVAVPLPTTRRRVREHLRAIGAPWNGRPPDPAFALRPLHALYQDVVEPLRAFVETDAVTIIPDAELATAPFAALLTAPADDFETAPYLLREWTVSTELAAALVTTPPPSAVAELDVLALGLSTFDADRFTWNGEALLPLPHVAREIEAVAANGDGVAFEDADATEAQFREKGPGARIIHLASHAEARPELPLYSRIALHEGGGDDGTLHLYEILNTPLRADLVVLSGCATADGGRQDGEGLVGLQYGMRAAGAGATLATLWPVADDATAMLMGHFYEELADGVGKDEALRQAQLAYLGDHEGLAASPFFWAAPVLSGNPAPVPFAPRIPWGWLLAIAASVAGWLAWRTRTTTPDA